jgi:hypothetical protein
MEENNNLINWDKHCYHCKFKEKCKKAYEMEETSGLFSIAGTHFCLESWNHYKNRCDICNTIK